MTIEDPITVRDAATLLGRSEKQVYRYIKRNLLLAEHGIDGKWYLSRRNVLEKSAHPERVPIDLMVRQMENLQMRVEYLEKQLDRLSYRTDMYRADAEERISIIEDKMSFEQTVITSVPLPVAPTAVPRVAVKSSLLPDGCIAAGAFAANHGVNGSTFRDHYTKGIRGEKLIISSRQKSGRNQLEWFVEEGQVQRVLDFWDRHGVNHT